MPTILAVTLALVMIATPVASSSLTGETRSPVTQTAAATGQAPQPRVLELKLEGIDPDLLPAARKADATPAPAHELEAHELHAQDLGTQDLADLKPAIAAELALPMPADLLAVTADRPFPKGTLIQVRVRESGRARWSRWNDLDVEGSHGPDPGSAEARSARTGSDPLLAVDAQRAQVRVLTSTGKAPSGTVLTAVDSPVGPTDARIPSAITSANPGVGAIRQAAMSGAAATGSGAPSMPSIVTRAQWGADEAMRRREPQYTDNVRVGFVHHTASTNRYTPAQAAAQVRSIYTYHTKSLGHSDIDYNFVVDRFGRLYEGRAGGMDRAVLGGHTAGFNAHSFAVSALGNFQTLKPAGPELAAIKDSIARLFAWKLGISGVNPGSTQKLVSAGFIRSTRYSRGAVAALPALTSHRAVNFTACPGSNLAAELDSIRTAAAAMSNVVISATSPPVGTFVTGQRSSVSLDAWATKPVSWRADVLSPCSDAPVRSTTGRSPAGPIALTWDLRDSAGRELLPANYLIRMTGTTGDGAAVPATSASFTIAPKPGGAWGPCGNASRVLGLDPSGTSVLWGLIAAPSARTVVLTGRSEASAASFAAGLAAAPLARKLGAPLLVTPAGKLDVSVAADLRARKATRVFVVGGTAVVSPATARAAAGSGAKVTRLGGSSDAATAKAVAAVVGGSPVTVDPVGAPASAVAGAALAASRGVPVAFDQGRTPEASDIPTASRLIADRFPGKPGSAMLLPASLAAAASAAVAASLGVPILFTDGASPAPAALAYLSSHPSVRSANTTVPSWALSDQVMGAASRGLMGLPWSPAGVGVDAGLVDPGSAAPGLVDTGLTAGRKVSRANAGPEPVRAGRKIRISAQVRARFTDGRWRPIPAGSAFDVQFRASGSKRYRIVASGMTTAGRAAAEVAARKSGRWRVVVTGKASASDYVRVRR